MDLLLSRDVGEQMIEEGNKAEAKYVWIKTKWGGVWHLPRLRLLSFDRGLVDGPVWFWMIAPYCFFLGLCIPLACCYYGDRVVGCVEINQCVKVDNSSLSHFAAAMTWPRWLRRAARHPPSPRHRAGVASMAWRTPFKVKF